MVFTILNMSNDSNKGDLAILESTILLIRKYFSEVKIYVLNCDYDDQEIKAVGKFNHLKNLPVVHYASFFPRFFTKKRSFLKFFFGVKNLLLSLWILSTVFFLKKRASFFIPRKYMKAFGSILSADLIILKGGSYLYSYGGLKQLLFLYRMLFTSLLSIFLKKKIIALSLSVGPMVGFLSPKLAKFCLKRIGKIVVREKISYKFVTQNLGVEEKKVDILPDIAFWCQTHSRIEKKEMKKAFEREGIRYVDLSRPRIGITVRKWNFPLQKNPEILFENYINTVAEVIDVFFLNYRGEVFIMPQVLEDKKIAEEIAIRTNYKKPFVLKGDYSPDLLRRIYKEMDLFIGTRTHSCIFALSSGTPVVGIAYEITKGFGIISMVEDQDYIIDIANINKEVLLDRMDRILSKNQVKRDMILKKSSLIQEEIEGKFSHLLNSVLRESPGDGSG